MTGNQFSNSGPPLTDESLANAERLLGRALPAALRRFYLVTNGGTPERRIYLADGDDHEVQKFLRIDDRPLDLVATYKVIVEQKRLVPRDLVPFATGSGGDYYCMNDEGQIYFVSMDPPFAQPQLVATSIDEFVDQMVSVEQAYG